MAGAVQSLGELRAVRDALIHRRALPSRGSLRPEIERSWLRCVASGVNPEILAPRYSLPRQSESQLLRASREVIQHRVEELADTSTSLLLADRNGLVLEFWSGDKTLARELDRSHSAPGFIMEESVAGTNGVGTVLEDGLPVRIIGGEHFADAWQDFTCVGVPVRHPITRKLQGVLNLTARYDDANHLMLPYAMLAAQEIEQQLYLHSSRNERLLLERFLSAQKRSNRPFIALNDQIVISNPAAARVLDELGQASLWEFAAQSIDNRESLRGTLELGSGDRVATTCLPVFDGRAPVGALIEIETPTRGAPQPRGLTIAAKPSAPRGVWHDVMAQARTLSDRGLPLLIVGEEGVGKVALVREVFVGEHGRGEVTVFDARAQSVDGTSVWVKRLGRALGADGGVVVVRHIEALDSSAARAACGLVDAYADGPVRLVGTMTDDAASAAYQPLVDRFAVASIRIPPLRDRMQDLPALLVSLTERHSTPGSRPPRWLPDAIQTLTRLDWPANVRQLENVVRRVLATRGDTDIAARDLPEEIRGQAPRRRLSHLERVELDAIMTALQQSRGNKSEAAAFLGISRATLYRKIRTFGVNLERNVF